MLDHGTERWRPFIRDDFPLSCYERLKIALAAVTILPIRLILLTATLVLYYLFVRIVSCLPFHARNRSRIIRRTGRWAARTMLFTCGFYFIRVEGKPHSSDLESSAPVIIANHVSYLDVILLMATCEFPSFVAKAAIARVPFIGFLCSANQAVYVTPHKHKDVDAVLLLPQTESKHSPPPPSVDPDQPFQLGSPVSASLQSPHRHSISSTESQPSGPGRPAEHPITQAILAHVAKCEQGEAPPMAIFPEGTTSNGRFLLKFHRGAFAPGRPVAPVVIKYPYTHFSLAWESFFFIPHILQHLCQWYNSASVSFLPVYSPSDEEKADPRLFSDKVRQLMLEKSQLIGSDSSRDDKTQYQSWMIRANAFRTRACCAQLRFWCAPRWVTSPQADGDGTRGDDPSSEAIV